MVFRLPLLCMNPSSAFISYTLGQFHLYAAASSTKSEVSVKIRCDIKLKKVGKLTRPFRYVPNQISLMIIQWKWKVGIQGSISDTQSAWRSIDKVHNIVQEAETKTIPKKKKFKKAKRFYLRGLTNSWEKQEKQKGKMKRKIYPFDRV